VLIRNARWPPTQEIVLAYDHIGKGKNKFSQNLEMNQALHG
jgi:hypothetical protein